jgi:hypothetical protein
MGHLPSLSIQDLLADLGVQDYLSPVPFTATAGVSDNVCIPTCRQCITPPAPCTHEYKCERYSYWKQSFPDFNYLLDDEVEERPVEDSKPVHVHTCRPVITKSIFRIPGPTAPLGFFRNRRARLEAQGLVGVPFSVRFHNLTFRKSSDLQMPVPYRGQLQQDYQADVCRFLKGVGLRVIRELGYNPKDMTDEAARDALVVVAEEVLKRAEQAAGPRLAGERPKGYKTSVWDPMTEKHYRPRTTTGQVWDEWFMDVCQSAAALAWEDYRPEYMAERSAMGARGGSASKRPRVFTVNMLIPYAGLTRPEQMAKLKCSKSVIARLRRELRALTASAEEPDVVRQQLSSHSSTPDITPSDELSRRAADCIRYGTHTHRTAVHDLHVPTPRGHRDRPGRRRLTYERFAPFRERADGRPSQASRQACLPAGPGGHAHRRGPDPQHHRHPTPGHCRRSTRRASPGRTARERDWSTPSWRRGGACTHGVGRSLRRDGRLCGTRPRDRMGSGAGHRPRVGSVA